MKERDIKVTTRVKESTAKRIEEQAKELGLSVYELLRVVLEYHFR